jgi:hypothetical protein
MNSKSRPTQVRAPYTSATKVRAFTPQSEGRASKFGRQPLAESCERSVLARVAVTRSGSVRLKRIRPADRRWLPVRETRTALACALTNLVVSLAMPVRGIRLRGER